MFGENFPIWRDGYITIFIKNVPNQKNSYFTRKLQGQLKMSTQKKNGSISQNKFNM